MGMSVAASSAIIFTGFLMVATVLFSAINMTVMDIQQEFQQTLDHQTDTSRTMLRVDNVTKNTTATFINITNIGSVTLSVNEIQIMVNGSLVAGKVTKHSVDGSTTTDIWAPVQKLYIELNYKSITGLRVMIVSGNGVSAFGVVT